MKMILFTTLMMLCLGSCARTNEPDSWEDEREEMVRQQIRGRGIKDASVLAAMRKVPRHLFVPLSHQREAYEDRPLPIGYDQTISQPYIVGYMTEILGLDGDERVLEIGTGSGYQAAVLGEIAREVYSVEIVKELADASAGRLRNLGYANVHVKHGDGFKGWPEAAPFDAIIITAAPPEIPEELIAQLKVGGRMIIPVGSVYQQLNFITRTEDGFLKKDVMPVRFVPMVKGK